MAQRKYDAAAPSMKLGIYCHATSGGLGVQTKRLAAMLSPHSVLLIDSSAWSRNPEQHPEWYAQFNGYKVKGFPNNRQIEKFLYGLTHVLVCETPFNYYLFERARQLGVKTYLQTNWEFLDYLNNPTLPEPDYFLMPSYWKLKEMRERFTSDRVIYLPPPIDPSEFEAARLVNQHRIGQMKLLHTIGTLAVHDRNGTLDLLNALEYARLEFSLTITSQHPLPAEYITTDSRVTYLIGNQAKNSTLYTDYDALILPRRYGGLALSCNEALMSGLPVLMPDISPNNELLPSEWLYTATNTDTFQARTPIEVYSSDPKQLGEKLDSLLFLNVNKLKEQAYELALREFSEESLMPRFRELW